VANFSRIGNSLCLRCFPFFARGSKREACRCAFLFLVLGDWGSPAAKRTGTRFPGRRGAF